MAPRKPRRGARPRPADHTQRLAKSIERLTGVVARVAADLEKLQEEQRVHLTRMGQLQAELDTVKRAWEKMHDPPKTAS